MSVSETSLTFDGTESQTVTVTATNNNDYTGDREVTVTFEADDYASATVTVAIEEDDPQPQIVLEVEPAALEVVTGESTPISITVSTTARITITSDPEGIAEAPASFGLNENGSTQIDVFGDRSGATTLTITADAVGYVSATTSVSVVVQDPLSIEVMPDMLRLVEDVGSTDISVSLNRIEAGREVTVRVTIDPTAGSELTVSPSSLTFSATKLQTTVTITAIDDRIYRGDREVTVTFEADDYASATVTVTIEEDDPQPQIELEVEPPALEIVTGESTPISITVSTTARITITSDPEGIAEALASFGLNENGSTQIDVFGDRSGATTLTITADAVGYVSATTSVSVVVQDPLSIEVMPASVSLVEMGDGNSTEISVNLNRIEAGRDTVTVAINLQEGSELTVSPSSLTFSATKLQTTVTITAIDDRIYRGDREVTVTFEADDYASATVTVTIEEDDPQPEIELAVAPTALNLVRFTSTEIEVSVGVDAILNIQTRGAVSLADENAFVSLNLSGKTSTRIGIFGNSVGDGQVGVTAIGTGVGTGAMQEMQIVMVTVSTPTLVISEVRPSNINLAARETTVVIVSVSAEAGEPSDVRLMATVLGTENVASVTPTEITVSTNTQTMFTVEGLDAGNTTLILTASHRDYISTITEVAVSVYLPPVGLSASTELEITVGTTEALTIQVNAVGAARTTLTTSIEISTIISVTAPATPESLTGGDTVISVTGDNQGETDLVIRVEADGYEATEITVRVRVIPVAALRFRIKVFLEGAQ